MFAAYKYSPNKYFYNSIINQYHSKGETIYEEHKGVVQKSLSEFISSDGIINGTKLRENWFPVNRTDIFISHSHKDIDKVTAFAGWLEQEFGLTSFIDSCAWGYCDKLLNDIDKRYCFNRHKETYDYKLRNYTTSHVHMMLSTALIDMMNQSECVIFFDTPESINMRDELDLIQNKKTQRTTSPWILFELTMISKLKRIKPQRDSYIEHSFFEKRNDFTVSYDVSRIIDKIPSVDERILLTWKNNHDPNRHALDELYKLTGKYIL